jgi:hypothetical protein
MSAGFTTGSYVATVAGILIAAACIFHVPQYRCWSKAAKEKRKAKRDKKAWVPFNLEAPGSARDIVG